MWKSSRTIAKNCNRACVVIEHVDESCINEEVPPPLPWMDLIAASIREGVFGGN